MKCLHCHREIVLVPSATERARKFGGTADDYTRLFQYHADCTLELRRKSESMKNTSSPEFFLGDISHFVNASQFHSMRGHVAHGTRVRFASGEVLEVRSAMRGWNLVGDDAKVSLGPFDGAMELTEAIVRRDNSV